MEPGTVVRQARLGHGISQRSLAIRAGTKQSTISRIEAGLESLSLERLERLLQVMGLSLELTVEPLPVTVDFGELQSSQRMTPSDRLRESASWNKLASAVERAAVRPDIHDDR